MRNARRARGLLVPVSATGVSAGAPLNIFYGTRTLTADKEHCAGCERMRDNDKPDPQI